MAARETNASSEDISVSGRVESDHRTSDIVLVEIAKLQSDREHDRSDLNELRSDMREMRDRMARLEVRVDHLPSKGFIVGVVVTALVIGGGLLTVAPKLQTWAGAASAPAAESQTVNPN